MFWKVRVVLEGVEERKVKIKFIMKVLQANVNRSKLANDLLWQIKFEKKVAVIIIM